MMKKLAVAAAGAALLLAVVAPAFADEHHDSSSSLTIKNESDLTNNVKTIANTGWNFGGSAHGDSLTLDEHHGHESGSILTGDALALAEVDNIVNTNDVSGCGCFKKVEIKNESDLTNNVLTVANTGRNFGGGSSISTGDAGAQALVTNVVNTNVVGGSVE